MKIPITYNSCTANEFISLNSLGHSLLPPLQNSPLFLTFFLFPLSSLLRASNIKMIGLYFAKQLRKEKML